MTEEQKNRWVAALRSRKFLQITQRLADAGDGRCCLGVLYEIETHKKPEKGTLTGDALMELESLEYDIDSASGFFIDLNDGVRLTFEEIALVIENMPESEWGQR